MIHLKGSVAAATLLIAGCLGAPDANAQDAGCYTLASLQGSYALMGTYGANVAVAFGARNLDGKGNLTGSFVLNEPTPGSTTGARTRVTGTQKGTYTVNCDGTGVITRQLTLADGTTAPGYDDFLITQAEVRNGQLIATALTDAQRTASAIVPGGIFLTRTWTLRASIPDTCYDQRSLSGSYGVVVGYGANLAMGLQPETLDGKGNLSRTGVNNQLIAGTTTGERTVANVTSKGTYTVNCDGTGTIDRVVTRPDGSKAVTSDDFLVTASKEKDGRYLATAIVDMQRDPSVVPPGGLFVLRTHTLRPAQTPGGSTPPAQTGTVAVAGPKNATVLTRSIQFDGSQSTSADGKALIYLWTVPPGSPAAAILGAGTPNPTVQFGQGRGIYTFQLTVTDSTGASATDVATVDYQGN